MYLFLKQPVSQWIASKSSFFKGMFECDLCLGMWAYWILALIFRVTLFEGQYIPVLSEFFVGAFMTFIAHLVRIGWEAKFSVINIGG